MKRLEAYKTAIQEAQTTEHEEADNTSLEEHLKQVGEAASAAGKEAARQAGEAKRAFDAQTENIKDLLSEQHRLYDDGKIDAAAWAAAQTQATDAAGAVGVAMPGGSSGSSSTQQGPSVGNTTSSGSGSNSSGPTQIVSTPKLAEGGVVSQPTTFVAGDSKTGGGADEAILPLSDPTAMRQVAPGIPAATTQEQSAFDPESIKRMMEAISSLTGTRDASQDFHFADSPAPRTVGEALGFSFGAPTPSVQESTGFTSGEPAPGDKPAFSFGEPTENEKADFLSSQPSVGEKPGFESATSAPTVGEALGFKFDTPYPGDKPVFSSGQPSAPEKPGFSLAAPSAGEQRDFAAASPQTVGDALGFSFSAPRTSYDGLGFTSGQPSGTATPGFSSGVQSTSQKPELNFGQPSAGERPGFDYSAPSMAREMPDTESLAANFGGLLSQPTLRSASNAQVPMAAIAGSPSATPIDLEARMEKFAERIGSQLNSENRSAGDTTTHIHQNIKGMISPDNLKKVMKKMNQAVNNRQASLRASDSLRVTRRSQ